MFYLLITLVFTGVSGPETGLVRMGQYKTAEDCALHHRFLSEVLFQKSSQFTDVKMSCQKNKKENDA